MHSPSRPRVVLDPLPRQRLRDLARGLVGREDERRPAAEDALEHRADERVVRAAEDHRVDADLLERSRVLADGGRELVVRPARLDHRNEPGARDGEHRGPRVECPDHVRVAPASNRALGREQADLPVSRRLHGRVRLGGQDAHHRNLQPLLQEWERGRGRRVARVHDQLDPGPLQVGGDLEREVPNLLRRSRPVGAARAVAEVDEVLVRERHETVVQHREPARARVEDPDRALVHGPILRAQPFGPVKRIRAANL